MKKNKYLTSVISVALASSTLSNTYAVADKQLSWWEQHPKLSKALKVIGATSLGTVGVAGTYYGGRFALDKIIPGREDERKKIDEYKTELQKVQNLIFNFKTEQNDEEGKKNSISDLIAKEKWLKEKVDSNSNFKDKFLDVAVVGGFVALAKGFMEFINSLGKFCKSVEAISYLRWAGANFVNMYNDVAEFLKSPPKEMKKEKALENLDSVFDGIYGQEKALSALKSYIFDIIIAKDQAKWNKKKYSKCDLIYLYGPSRVGKSFVSKKIPEALLLSGEPLTISSSAVNKEKKESVVEQLLSFGKQGNGSNRMSANKPLITFLKNGGKVLIIEEYDKICTSALDEVFRGMYDFGTVIIDGEEVDCSGLTVIFTSNEDDTSMEGFDPKNVKDLDEKSIKEGHTRIEHSKSFLNRIKKVKFENLTAEEYKTIIKDHFDAISSYWRSPENGNIEIALNNDSIEYLAKEVEKKNQGAGPIDIWIMPAIQIVIGEKVKSVPEYEYFNGKSLEITYNLESKKFEINEKNVITKKDILEYSNME